MSDEFDFYLKADLKKYEGKYIAIIGNKVVASGTNAKHVISEAKKKYPDKKPTLAKVPKEETMILVSKLMLKRR